MPDPKQKAFPPDFLWGASTSAHQVEGDTHNQWTVWELGHAAELAKSAEHRLGWLPNWNQIKDQATDPENYISGRAVDHYHLYQHDFDQLQQIGLNTLRFGIEWSRIEPEEGRWNEREIEHYKKYIAELKKRGIQPVVNLWHWTIPVWFDEKGGFTRRKNNRYFVRYVKRIAKDLLVPCGIVITLNEPNSYIGMSFMEGLWPPQKHNPLQAGYVLYNLSVLHKELYRTLKEIEPSLMVGVATQCNNSRPKEATNLLDKLVARSANYGWNWWFLNRVKKHQDFVGFNYYFTDYFHGLARKNPHRHNKTHHTGHRGIHRQRRHNPPGPLSDLGWYMEPSGIGNVLMEAHKRYQKPIIITETGVADANDQYRKWWLEETLSAVIKANSDGADIRGYMIWSLLDNFEWADGWWPKFGLVEVNHKDLKRKPRPSAKWLASYIKSQ